MAYQNLLIVASFILLYSIFAKKIEGSVISGPFLAIAFGVLFGPMVLNLFQSNVETEEYRIIAELILTVAFTIVLSVVLHGFTAKPFIKALKGSSLQ